MSVCSHSWKTQIRLHPDSSLLNKIDTTFGKVTESPVTLKLVSKCHCFGVMHTWNVLANKCVKEKKKLLLNINCIFDKCFHMCITQNSLDILSLRLLSCYSGKKPLSKPMLLMIFVQCRGMIKPYIHCGSIIVAKKYLNWGTCTQMIKQASWKVTSVISFSSYGFPEGIVALSASFNFWSFFYFWLIDLQCGVSDVRCISIYGMYARFYFTYLNWIHQACIFFF